MNELTVTEAAEIAHELIHRHGINGARDEIRRVVEDRLHELERRASEAAVAGDESALARLYRLGDEAVIAGCAVVSALAEITVH